MTGDAGAGGYFRALPSAFWWLWAGQLINRTAGFVIPFMALFAAEKGLSTPLVGAVATAFGVGCLVASLAGGALVDVVGRRPVILWSQVLTAGATMLLAVTDQPAMFATAMFAVGFFGNAARPAMAAVVVDVVPAERLVQAYGALHWAYNIGFSVTPLLAAAFATQGMQYLLFAEAATLLLVAVLVYLRVPESRPTPTGEADKVRLREGIGLAVRDRAFLALTLLVLLVAVVMNQYNLTLPLAMRADQLPTSAYALAIAVNGILITLLQLPLSRFTPSRRAFTGAAVGALLYGVGFGAGVFADSAIAYGVTVAIWTFGEMVFAPSSAAAVALLSPEHNRGLYQGVNSLAFSGSSVLAPVAGVWLLNGQGADAVWTACFIGGMTAAAGLLLLGRRARTPGAAARPEQAAAEPARPQTTRGPREEHTTDVAG